MKRAGIRIESVADRDNLLLAFCKARRGKRLKVDAIAFGENLDTEIDALRAEILSGAPRVGDYRHFTIYDPKERTICAAAFRERVLHHALMNVCDPVFERAQIHDSHACRRGKGLDGALTRGRRFCAATEWWLKLDVRKYFDSIDHTVLKGQLRRLFKDTRILAIFDAIIDSHQTAPGRGLPIGNLTSQYFANHHLAPLDRHAKQELGARRYLRYMDDIVVWDDDKDRLRTIRDGLAAYTVERLGLELKPPVINRTRHGMDFLGYRLTPRGLALNRRSRVRFRRKMRAYRKELESGAWSAADYAAHVEPLIAFALRADSRAFREQTLATDGGAARPRTA